MADKLFRVLKNTYRKLIDMGDGTHAPQVVAELPSSLVTDENGENPRLRVDQGQTGFFAGREFRTFREFNTAFTGTWVIRVEVPVNIIVFQFGIECDGGFVRMESVIGGTEGGTYSELMPLIPRNSMTEAPQPPYQPQLTIRAGGTYTGGNTTDVIRLRTDSNVNRAFTIQDSGGSNERGIGPTTLYLRSTMEDFTGIIRGWWEERP